MSRILLIDLSSLWWTNFHVHAESGIQEPRKATLAGVNRCMGEGDWKVAICCDSPKNFRKEISKDYKANREKQSPAVYGELTKTKERLADDGFLLWEVEGFEADDIIGTATKMARDAGHEVRIASADKDLLALCGPGVDVLRTSTWEVWDSRKVTEELRIDPGQMTDFLALNGDKSDNVPGCAGIGKVRAAELLTEYQSIDRIYEVLASAGTVATPAIDKALKDNRTAVETSRKLVALRTDVPINFDEIFAERDKKPLVEVEEFEVEPESPPPAESTELVSPEPAAVVSYRTEFTQQLEPRSFKELTIGCKILFNAQIYSKFPSYESMVGAALRGREMGYGLGASLDIFHVMEIKGVRSLALHAHVIIDRAMRDPDCEYIECIETTAEQATYELKRKSRPEPFKLTYTIEQARKAGLAGNRMWDQRPAEQLRKTCGVQGCRVVFPGAAMGLYCLAELGGDE
jgi:5'-3' exonuclease